LDQAIARDCCRRTSFVIAGTGINRFLATEGEYIERDRREAQSLEEAERERERIRRLQREAEWEIERLGARVEPEFKSPGFVIDLSWWSGTNQELAKLALLAEATSDEEFTNPLCIKSSDLRFDDESLRYLATVPGIYSLNLTGTQITDSGLRALQPLLLQSLYLNDTAISDDGLRSLEPFRMTLSSLYLNRTAITDDGLIHLKGFGQLRTLSLTGTQVSGIGLRCLEDSWEPRMSQFACHSRR